ncbi:hypothetical protein CHLRE_15g643740v5 [Chlamydomonas reinhardtii]|uniref:Uncharacterized protein n=1 Tax=Chlamydomonas reinhardtii TaxID=3055 RepID=A0A2K3CWY0_CHLRE|nr:uncharacterized protein CHLRE_15g643740v5 [Chlamydomonas reinhardtii]PNW72797.1 hypothetical protein CHLRE_15g643740v5 [Chlamydomonas reinhardtii]
MEPPRSGFCEGPVLGVFGALGFVGSGDRGRAGPRAASAFSPHAGHVRTAVSHINASPMTRQGVHEGRARVARRIAFYPTSMQPLVEEAVCHVSGLN